MEAKLVKTNTQDKLLLSGLLVRSNPTKPTILFIHGFEGDFYTNDFITSIGETLQKNDLNLLTVQTRGTAAHQALLDTDGNWHYLGAHYEKLEEAYMDIDAWIHYLEKNGYENIILAGHSLGTIKVLRYLFEGEFRDAVKKVILLCPFDKNWLLKDVARQVDKDIDELIKEAEIKVSEGKGNEVAPYGFNDVPHSYTNYLSWYSNDEFKDMFDFHVVGNKYTTLNKIQVPVHVVVGSNDEFFHPSNPEHPEEAMDILLKNLKHGSGKLIEGAKHSFKGYENEVAEGVLNFIKE